MDSHLKQKLNKLPASPGVYFHKNNTGEIIYVGKAAVLKNRVRQYFQKSQKDPKTEALVTEIYDTDWIEVDTEMDALFLESEMIKRYKPKWNILLRDDKTVSYVKITMQESVPYVSVTRTPLDDGADYIGPFYGKSAIERALRILRRIFPYYTKPYSGAKNLDTDLGLTPGIEVGEMTPAEYKKNLRKLIRYLKGDKKTLLDDLSKAMSKASKSQDFETAAKLRNQIFGLKEIKRKIVFSDKEFMDISSDMALMELKRMLNLAAPPRRIEGYDISHQSGEDTVGSMVVFLNGVAARNEYRKFKVRTSTNDDLKSMQEVITRRIKHQEWEKPDLIILDGGQLQVEALLPIVGDIPVIGRDKSGDHSRSAEVKIYVPFSGIHVLESSSHVARLIARIDEEAHRFAITYHNFLKQRRLYK